MKIGIDARFYGPLGKGLGRYTQKLIKYLEEVDKENQYVVFLRRENWNEYIPQNKNFNKYLADCQWYSLQEQFYMPRIIKKHKIDLMHFPHFNVPFFYRGKFVVTIHDLILIKFPTKKATTLDPLLYKIKYYGYKRIINYAVKKAQRIITVSKYTKGELIKYFNIDSEKIIVTYEACNGVESGQLSIPELGFLKDFRITKPYILYVGNAYPHKNLEKLLVAFKDLLNRIGSQYQLVLVGKNDYFYDRLKNNARKLGLLENSDVIFFGFASEKQLADLYRNAKVYIFPSYIEGFGLPPLEAMSYGLPVLSSNTSCLPEILGDAAIYFNPHSQESIVKTMQKALLDRGLRKEISKKGFKKVSEYSWQKCAQETLRAYKI